MDSERGRLINTQKYSEETGAQQDNSKWTKKKKTIVGLASLIVIAAVVTLIVILVKKKSDDNNSNNSDDDNNLLDFQEFNPFVIPLDQPVVKQVWYYNGILQNSNFTPSEKQQKFMENQIGASQMKYKPVDPQQVPTGANNLMREFLQFNFSLVNNYEARVQIGAVGGKNYSVTNESSPRIVQEFEARFTQLGFNLSGANQTFSWSLRNIYNNETIVNTTNRKMIVQDKYSEIGFVLPNSNIFGLGVANRQFKLQTNSTYTLWAKSRQEEVLEVDEGVGSQQSSQVLPFLLGQTNTKNDWYGIFFVGSAAQSFELIYVPGQPQVILNYIQLSDQLEFYVIMRGSPKSIIQRYQHQIGYPSMPPYYALGIFAGSQKQGDFSNSSSLQTLLGKYNELNLPIEGVILDQYTIDNIYPFSEDTTDGFGSLQTVKTFLESQNMKMILGVQSHISTNTDGVNPVFNQAKNIDQCLLQNGLQTSDIYTLGQFKNMTSNKSDPGQNVTFVDVFNTQAAQEFYNYSFGILLGYSSFDGIYLRGNTPFIENQQSTQEIDKKHRFLTPQDPEQDGEQEQYFNTDQSIISYNNFPFVPGYYESGNLTNNTIDQGIVHTGFNTTSPPHPEGVPHAFVHNMYGFMQHKAVWNTLFSNNPKRPNIYSESAWPGSGFYGGSWTQPLNISWESLQNSISMSMSAGINGINNWVTEICGIESFQNGILTDDQIEICTRWAEIAAYLPMVRIKGDLSEYIVYNNQSSALMIQALNQRLPITRYIYSQMFACNYTGGSLVYPLYFDYPDDDNALQNIEQTFMLGDALKITPVFQANSPQTQVYFPQGVWRSLNNFSDVINATQGMNVTLNTPLGTTQVHIKDGKILPWQQIKTPISKPYRTYDMTKQGITLVVNRDSSNYADGYVLVDDGVTQSNFANNLFTFWKIRFAEKAINFWVERGDYLFDVTQSKYGSQKIDQLLEIQILGAEDLSDANTACFMGKNLQPVQMNINYDNSTEILSISPKNISVAFRDLGFIKFYNNMTEPNVCNTTTFQYSGVKNDDQSTDQTWIYSVTPQNNVGNLQNLVAVFSLMDDEGTINFNLTYEHDYQNNYKNIFRPINVIQDSQYDQSKVTKTLDQYLNVTLSPFSFDFSLNGQIIYSLNSSKLFMSDYLVMDSGIFNMNALNQNPLMGMGERAGDLFFQNETGGIHSRWSHDAANPIDDGEPPGRNMYGFQPFYVYQSNATDFPWVGVFNNNPYATDYIVYTNNGNKSEITTITIGGAIEKWFFIGSKPDDVIIKYEKLTGMPTMPPQWSFGWQQCRFGWVTDQIWQQVVDNYTEAYLPLDTMWADIDYMDDYKVFTISNVSYGNLSNQVKAIRQKNMTFVPIMDAGVAVRNDPYFALDQGVEMGIFIKQAYSDNPLTAGVWCGNAYFPDFYNKDAESYWHQMFDRLVTDNNLELDGIWLDMNEATNFCDGYCITDERPKNSLRNKPYYVPGSRDLENESLGVDGVHYADQSLFNKTNLTEYDVHNTFSLMQVRATANYLKNKGLRPYVLSRSNFQGLQKYGYHWLGDNWSWVEYMVASVKNIYEYQLFGLPFMGCDLCGFNGDAPSDLCTRWHQVGTLFPFARNHNQNATKPQEPYRFTDKIRTDSQVEYVDLIRTAILNRYTMLRYYYSAFWQINQYGGSFFKPLFFEFPSDPLAYKDIEINMLLGNGLKASVEVRRLPNEADGKPNSTAFYFPNGTWCQVIPYVQNDMSGCIQSNGSNSGIVTLPTEIEDYYVHVRNGFIIPLQNATAQDQSKPYNHINNTKDQMNQFTDLYIVPNAQNSIFNTNTMTSVNGSAYGFIYFDDGVSMDSYEKQSRIDFVYQIENQTQVQIEFYQVNNTYKSGSMNEQVGNITIFSPFQNSTDLTALPSVQLFTIQEPTQPVSLGVSFLEGTDQGQILEILVSDASSQYRFDQIQNITISWSLTQSII